MSLNVASDDDDDDNDDDVHVACFSSRSLKTLWSFLFKRCTVHFGIYKVHTPTNVLFRKPDKILKFSLKLLFLLHLSQ